MEFNNLIKKNKIHRIVTVSSLYVNKISVSYGLIVFCVKTKRMVLVRRKHSIAFLMIMGGMYRESYLWDYIKNLTKEEAEIIRKCINSKRYFDFSHKKLSFVCKLELCKNKFYKNIFCIKEIFSRTKNFNSNLQWYWPKGKTSHNGEVPFECAKREFLEEVESILPEPIYIHPIWINNFFLVNGNKKIENNFLLYIINEEFEIKKKVSSSEISERGWFDLNTCKKLISDDPFFNIVLSYIPNQFL